MRAAVPEALSVGLPGGDPAACLARLRHHWALDTWRRLGLGVGFGLGLKLGSELGLANPNPTPNTWRSTPSTSEDTLRTQMYRERAARKVFRKEL